jgi:hypothetical protein
VDKFVPAKGEVFAAKSYQQFEKRRARLGMNAVKKKRRAPRLRRTPLKLSKEKLAHVAIYRFGDLLLGDRADNLLDNLAVFENENSGDAADIVATRRVHRFVHVEFHHFNFARVLVRDFRNRGGKHVTRAAPFRPEIDEYRLRLAGRKYFAFEISICSCLDVFRHVLCFQRLGPESRRLSPYQVN